MCLKCYNKVHQALSYFAFEVSVFYNIKYTALWTGGFRVNEASTIHTRVATATVNDPRARGKTINDKRPFLEFVDRACRT